MSFLAWLDHSTEDERRVREMIRLFDQPETQDALGFGQVRDAYADLLFPGTSTLHTRAKYLLFIPWCWMLAAARHSDPVRVEQVSRENERRLIQTLSTMPDHTGLIGGRSGASLRTLPSVTYGSALERWHIRDNRGRGVSPTDDDSEDAAASYGWHRQLPPPPHGFPQHAPGAFNLSCVEAEYLQGRLLSIQGPPSLLWFLAQHLNARLEEPTVWAQLDHVQLPHALLEDVRLARTFSQVSHGANLLYNFLVAQAYEQAGYTSVEVPVEISTRRLDTWADSLSGTQDSWATWEQIRPRACDANARIVTNAGLDQFAQTWFSLAAASDPHDLWRSSEAQELVRSRETSIKRRQSRFTNLTMLARWGGASGANPYEFRWTQVRGLLNDIGDGLGSADGALA